MSDKPQGILTLQESEHILRRELDPTHYNDARVITFIRSYLLDYSVPIACRDAVISTNRGYQLLKSPDIKQCIEKLEAKSAAGANFRASGLIRRMEEIAHSNIMDIFRDDGTVRNKSEMNEILQRCIAGFKVKVDYEKVLDMNGIPTGKTEIRTAIYDVKMFDKIKAVELLARDEGIFRETKVIQHDLGKNAASILLQAEERALLGHARDVEAGTPEAEPVELDFTGDSMPVWTPSEGSVDE